MFNSAMIKYDVNEETKVVVASVEGIAYDAIDTMLKTFRRQNIILTESFMTIEPGEPDEIGKVNWYETKFIKDHTTVCKKYLLPNSLMSEARYDPDDPNKFSIERGKQIARRRLYDAYNKVFKKALSEIIASVVCAANDMDDMVAVTEKRMINFEYFEYYDVFKHHESESMKL